MGSLPTLTKQKYSLKMPIPLDWNRMAYGLLNFRGGIEYKNITLALWGNNLLGEEYIISAGNTGSLFGAPTQIPGSPLMFGTTFSWKF